MKKILSKVEKATMKVAASEQEKQELYNNVKKELPTLEDKLNKWLPRNPLKKKLKADMEQCLASLKETGSKCYSADKMKFEFIKNNL